MGNRTEFVMRGVATVHKTKVDFFGKGIWAPRRIEHNELPSVKIESQTQDCECLLENVYYKTTQIKHANKSWRSLAQIRDVSLLRWCFMASCFLDLFFVILLFDSYS